LCKRDSAARERLRAAATRSFRTFRRSEVERSIPFRFREIVREYGERLAVKDPACELTYGDLDRASGAIARAIVDERGPCSEPVALFLPNGAAVITAVLGVLKAGKFYVPLSVRRPKATCRAMLEDSAARLLITDAANADAARELADDRLAFLDVDEMIGTNGGDDPLVEVEPDAFAYIYYTSGSTGAPKGVADNHRNVLHNVMRYTNSLCISPDDRLTLLQSPVFSGAASSMFCALLNGASVFPRDPLEAGPQGTADWLRCERITVYHSVPALFRYAAAGGGPFPSLRVVRLEGDRAAPRDVELFREKCGDDCVLVNGLGATECGLVRQFFIDKGTEITDGVPIGYAVQDMEISVLDENGSPLAAGATGEIAVASRFLATGYWGRPDLTAAAFAPEEGAGDRRVYRTGDLGRIDGDGCLHYLGRRDFEVRIRGRRVETAKVESALAAIDSVHEAVVAGRGGGQGGAKLVAYIVAEPGREPAADVLRKHLARSLPDHMVPGAFVMLAELPLNENGKVDRGALPDPPRTRPVLENPYRAPSTPVETMLCRIWAEVLVLDEVGVDDGFLDLGGDSLKAAAVISRVSQHLGVYIEWEFFPANRTVADMALEVAARGISYCGDDTGAPAWEDYERL
jgi:amino acid adenylation domain-containing protein